MYSVLDRDTKLHKYSIQSIISQQGCNLWIYTCFLRTGVHGHDGYEEGGEDINYGEEEVHFDGPGQLRLRPSEPRQTQDRHAYAQLEQQTERTNLYFS